MVKRYYLKEIAILIMFCWIITATSKVNNLTDSASLRTDKLQEEVDVLFSLINELHEMVYNLKHNIEKFEGLDALDFPEAFKQMRQEYGEHHLFEWRGRVFTTDMENERNQ